MKQRHILNIGYPKCGTTWLWDNLIQNNSISDHSIKENTCLINGTPVIEYCQQYSNNVTANFNPSNIVLDQYVIEQLSQKPQIYVSIILRHPIELMWSLYNFLKIVNVDFETYCYQLHDTKLFSNPTKIISRWKNYFDDRFIIFWYEDLAKDNLKFYLNYCEKMGLNPGSAIMSSKINTTSYKNTRPDLDKDILDQFELEFENMLVYR